MKRHMTLAVTGLCVLGSLLAAMGQSPLAFDARHRALLSKLQSMGHGYYTAAEWAKVDADVDALVADATARADGNAIVRAAVIHAMVQSDMRRQHPEALAVLKDAIERVKTMDGVDASPLFVKEAEVYAEAGDPAGVTAVINAYKASPYYDPKPYAWSGGAQPGDPLLIARPRAEGGDSLPLTVMEKAQLRARSAPGTVFPDATLTDLQGNTFALSSLRGKVVLVDFFARGWKIWEENLPQLQDLWQRSSASGFEVVSVCVEPNATGLEALNLPWKVVINAKDLTRELGIFGETTSYLLNKDGRVIARDLRGSDLVFAVQRALEQ